MTLHALIDEGLEKEKKRKSREMLGMLGMHTRESCIYWRKLLLMVFMQSFMIEGRGGGSGKRKKNSNQAREC
jgi:hypothetical protein